MMPITENLNIFLGTTVFQNTIQSYVLTLLTFMILLISFSFTKRLVIHHLGRLAAKTASDFDDLIVKLLAQIGWPVFIVISLHIAVSVLILPSALRSFIRYAVIFVVTIRAILLLQEIIQYTVNKTLIKRIGQDNPSSQAMVNSVLWMVKWGMWLLGGIFILDNLGINITSLVAGIGIGGIAVAMASQAVLGDAFSALSIYLD
ncbi:MAG: mechanosensitive ion channel, partial [Candidatus Omnitrophica bacterium]|nr:mechanosensitive ion channel [Candidatus Omnitrophota bacterium]